MSDQLVSEPLGPNGSVSVVESAGKLIISLQAAQLSGGISESVSISIGAASLVSLWAASTSNATLKGILSAAAAELAALPA